MQIQPRFHALGAWQAETSSWPISTALRV